MRKEKSAKANESEFYKLVIKKLQDSGKAQEILKQILHDELFDNLSKHDPFWESDDEKVNDRLHKMRLTLNWIQEKLWDVHSMLDSESE